MVPVSRRARQSLARRSVGAKPSSVPKRAVDGLARPDRATRPAAGTPRDRRRPEASGRRGRVPCRHGWPASLVDAQTAALLGGSPRWDAPDGPARCPRPLRWLFSADCGASTPPTRARTVHCRECQDTGRPARPRSRVNLIRDSLPRPPGRCGPSPYRDLRQRKSEHPPRQGVIGHLSDATTCRVANPVHRYRTLCAKTSSSSERPASGRS